MSQIFIILSFLVLTLTRAQPSSLSVLCDEFIKNNVNSATIAFNYLKEDQNITKVLQVESLRDWCEEIVKTSYVRLTSAPPLSIGEAPDPSWYTWVVPMAASTFIGLVALRIAYNEWRILKASTNDMSGRLATLE